MNKRKLVFKYLTFDIIASLVIWVLFMVFRKTVNDAQVFGSIQVFVPNYDFFSSLLLFPLSCIFVHYLTGFYLQSYKKSLTNVIFTTFFASIIISVSIFFVLMLDDIVLSYQYYYYSLLVLLGLSFFITLISRLFIWTEVRNNFKTKKWKINTLIIGTGENALRITRDIEAKSQQNNIIGFITVDNIMRVNKDRVLGNMSNIDALISENSIEEAIILLDNPDEQKLFKYINTLFKYNIDIRFTPRLYEILTGSARMGAIGINPLVTITNVNMSDWEISLKRFFDIVISFLSLVFLSPVFVYFAIFIKRDSKGPVFYKQERIGLLGKPFDILKFRTMHQGAENGVPKLSNANDDRVTNIGKVLRKYRIDELPQFWNVLKGEMSLVGPRPERKFYINQIIELAPYYCLLYKIRPGLTSWGPIKIGYSDTLEKMIERLNYDVIYMENMTLLNDLKILILTFEIIFKGKGV